MKCCSDDDVNDSSKVIQSLFFLVQFLRFDLPNSLAVTQKPANGPLRNWNQDATFTHLSITPYLFIYLFIICLFFMSMTQKKMQKKLKHYSISHLNSTLKQIDNCAGYTRY